MSEEELERRRENRKFAITQAVLMYRGVTATYDNCILFAKGLERYLNEEIPEQTRDEELANKEKLENAG